LCPRPGVIDPILKSEETLTLSPSREGVAQTLPSAPFWTIQAWLKTSSHATANSPC
jgi:hypothetical protein